MEHKTNVTFEAQVGIAICFVDHGEDGIALGYASGLKNNTALKYLHQVFGLIGTKLVHKRMVASILSTPPLTPTEQDSLNGMECQTLVGALMEHTFHINRMQVSIH